MKVIVIGGTGLIGSKLVEKLNARGHDAQPAAPQTGVNTLTNEGVDAAVAGADVLVDVLNSPSFADDDVMNFFTTSTGNLLAAAKNAGVSHYLVLSVVGDDRLPDSGYLRAKLAQEKLVADSGIPYSMRLNPQSAKQLTTRSTRSSGDPAVRLASDRLASQSGAAVRSLFRKADHRAVAFVLVEQNDVLRDQGRLFAALNIATGKVTSRCQDRHRHEEFLVFLRQVARAYPAVELHLVMDNYAAHNLPAVTAWLEANPRLRVHFTPTHASWMNLVEVWFSIAERQAIHRGTYGSVRDLTRKIRTFVDGWNDRSHPFTWTRPAEEILAEANRKKTSNAEH